MKLNPTHLKKTTTAAIVISAITLSSVGIIALAQNAPPPPPGGPSHMNRDHMGKEHDLRSGPMQPGLQLEQIARLKNSLKLNPQQTALWDKAGKAMQPAPELRAKMQEEMKARHEQTLAALADPKFDPRKFSAEMEKQQAALQAEHKAKAATVREAWFSVYDSLDAGQRGQAREFLRERLESRRGLIGHMGGMNGMRAWGQDHDGRGPQFRPPMEPTPPTGPAGNMPPPAPPSARP